MHRKKRNILCRFRIITRKFRLSKGILQKLVKIFLYSKNRSRRCKQYHFWYLEHINSKFLEKQSPSTAHKRPIKTKLPHSNPQRTKNESYVEKFKKRRRRRRYLQKRWETTKRSFPSNKKTNAINWCTQEAKSSSNGIDNL